MTMPNTTGVAMACFQLNKHFNWFHPILLTHDSRITVNSVR